MTKLKQEDIEWIETRLSRVVSDAELIAPRAEFIQRAKAELMDLPIPKASRARELTLWAALGFAVAAIVATIWFMSSRRRRSRLRA